MSNVYDVTDYRSPERIATEINIIKDQTFKTVIMNSIEIGKKLCEAKELVQHGEWGNWLKEKVDYSQDTANNLMRIYKEYGNDQLDIFDRPNSETFKNLGYSQAVALLSIPKEDRAEFAEEHKADELSIKKLKEEIEDWKRKNKTLENEKQELEEITDKLSKVDDQYIEKLKSTAEEEIKKELEAEMNKANDLAQKAEDEKKEANKKLRDIKKQAKEAEEKATKAEDEKNNLLSQIDETKKKAAEDAELKAKEELEKLKKAKEEAENKIIELEKKSTMLASGDTQKLQAHFEIFQRTFIDMTDIIKNMEDQEQAKKFTAGINKMLDNMSCQLQ